MAIKSDAQRRAVARYKAAHYEQVQLRLDPGDRDIIQQHAAERGESVNSFIKRAISETISRDRAEPAADPADG